MMKKAKILFFAADPQSIRPGGTSRLQLDAEVRKIRKRVSTATRRDDLEFDTHWAARPGDLVQALGETRPRVVHFSGHCGHAGLVLVGSEASRGHNVDGSALAQLFAAYPGDIRVVVLNACLSLPQAEAIAGVVGCAIGTGSEITDDAAIAFSSAFYRAIAFGDSVQAAFDRARAALALEHFEERDCPRLVVRPGTDAGKVFVLEPEAAVRTRARTWWAAAAALAIAVAIGGKVLADDPGEACAWAGAPEAPETTSVVSLVGTAGAPPGLDRAKRDYADGRYASAFARFRRAAQGKDPEAMGYVGIMFLRGQGTDARPDSGIHWLREAAYKQDPKAMTALGAAYEHGEGVSRSLHRARQWYNKAADLKDWPEAMRSLGALDLRDKDYAQALAQFQRAVKAGSLEARIDAGHLYEQGQGIARNPEVARCLYRTAAEAGSLRGMLIMGRSYRDGIGVSRDYDEAGEWYRKAADRGSPEAMQAIGELYLNGLGVPRDTARATYWFRKARDAGPRKAGAR
jgi:TPR repeat protein